jgi:hypothetical protein
MADYQVPVNYSALNSNYQDNTTNAITARHGRQLVANAAPFFFDLVGREIWNYNLPVGQTALITKQWLDDNGNNTYWGMNGFLVKQSDNTYLIENVTGSDLLLLGSTTMFIWPFATADHKFWWKISQQEPGEPLRGFLGHGFTEVSFDGTNYHYQIRDTVARRVKKDSKLKLELRHDAGTGNPPLNILFRLNFLATGGWRGYSARYYDNLNNADRGQDIGGIKYE